MMVATGRVRFGDIHPGAVLVFDRSCATVLSIDPDPGENIMHDASLPGGDAGLPGLCASYGDGCLRLVGRQNRAELATER